MHFPPKFLQKPSPYFFMVHLLHRLYGVDAPGGRTAPKYFGLEQSLAAMWENKEEVENGIDNLHGPNNVGTKVWDPLLTGAITAAFRYYFRCCAFIFLRFCSVKFLLMLPCAF